VRFWLLSFKIFSFVSRLTNDVTQLMLSTDLGVVDRVNWPNKAFFLYIFRSVHQFLRSLAEIYGRGHSRFCWELLLACVQLLQSSALFALLSLLAYFVRASDLIMKVSFVRRRERSPPHLFLMHPAAGGRLINWKGVAWCLQPAIWHLWPRWSTLAFATSRVRVPYFHWKPVGFLARRSPAIVLFWNVHAAGCYANHSLVAVGKSFRLLVAATSWIEKHDTEDETKKFCYGSDGLPFKIPTSSQIK